MPFPVTPIVGTTFDEVQQMDEGKSHDLGTALIGSDGRKYVLVEASAAIGASTAVTITEPAFTAAAGAGGFETPAVAIASGEAFWARKQSL